ncbi:M20 family metallo-hydrolase [Pseudonocardia aurantiaca]|uniref:M20 family metallo-hydrolase n=1 Tax=Pseudonocardia aurantiaca TaxID=75290 RepID=A0ABW4FYU7_9PSEU
MNQQDVLEDFTVLSSLGATPGGGVDRQAATETDGQARRWLVEWLTDNGFAVTVDRVGNIFGTVEWVPGAPFVLMGSHLDSQPTAGRFDGAYGVLAAAHAARRIVADVAAGALTPRLNIAVVDWFNEEGSRFTPSIMGSTAYCGGMAVDDVLATRDLDGTSVEEALRSIGFLGDGTAPQAACYAEIHIEQGRVLERLGADIGLVESNWAARKYEIVVHGTQSHTGATVMADRHDALVGASRIVCLARDVVDEFPEGALLTAVGRMTVHPNSPVVVPSEVRLSLDVRSADADLVEQAHALLLERMAGIGARTGVEVEVARSSLRHARPFRAAGVDLAETVAEDGGATTHRMQTMAGHDAIPLNTLVPTVLLFVPSVEGVSHNERELTHDDDLLRGVDVLSRLGARLVEGALPCA